MEKFSGAVVRARICHCNTGGLYAYRIELCPCLLAVQFRSQYSSLEIPKSPDAVRVLDSVHVPCNTMMHAMACIPRGESLSALGSVSRPGAAITVITERRGKSPRTERRGILVRVSLSDLFIDKTWSLYS